MEVGSISFGRFESDSSLAWEKFSVFSHNRLMEEVQKYAIPGSVAEKKAYFEAYYKRKCSQIGVQPLDPPEDQATSPNTENCDVEIRIRTNTERTGTADVNSEDVKGSLKEANKVQSLGRSDPCYEPVDSCDEPRSSSSTTLVGNLSQGKEKTQYPPSGSQNSFEICEDQHQLNRLELSNKVGNEPLKESVDINKEVLTVDRTKKKSVVSPEIPCRSYVDMPTKDGTPTKHLKSLNTVPNMGFSTPSRKKRASWISKFRNKTKSSNEVVELRMPPTEKQRKTPSVEKEMVSTSTSCKRSVSLDKSGAKCSCFCGINRLFTSSSRPRNEGRKTKRK